MYYIFHLVSNTQKYTYGLMDSKCTNMAKLFENLVSREPSFFFPLSHMRIYIPLNNLISPLFCNFKAQPGKQLFSLLDVFLYRERNVFWERFYLIELLWKQPTWIKPERKNSAEELGTRCNREEVITRKGWGVGQEVVSSPTDTT